MDTQGTRPEDTEAQNIKACKKCGCGLTGEGICEECKVQEVEDMGPNEYCNIDGSKES